MINGISFTDHDSLDIIYIHAKFCHDRSRNVKDNGHSMTELRRLVPDPIGKPSSISQLLLWCFPNKIQDFLGWHGGSGRISFRWSKKTLGSGVLPLAGLKLDKFLFREKVEIYKHHEGYRNKTDLRWCRMLH